MAIGKDIPALGEISGDRVLQQSGCSNYCRFPANPFCAQTPTGWKENRILIQKQEPMKKIIMAAALLCMGIFGMQAQTLKFNSNKKFKIVQFTGYTLGTREYGFGRSCQTHERSAGRRKTGPGHLYRRPDLCQTRSRRTGQSPEPAIYRRIPFAVTWGNHDDEQDMNRKELSDYIEKKPAA